MLLLPFQLKDEESIRQAVRYSNVVVNLIGTRWETKNYSFEETHIEGARRIARIAKEMGVQRLANSCTRDMLQVPLHKNAVTSVSCPRGTALSVCLGD